MNLVLSHHRFHGIATNLSDPYYKSVRSLPLSQGPAFASMGVVGIRCQSSRKSHFRHFNGLVSVLVDCAQSETNLRISLPSQKAATILCTKLVVSSVMVSECSRAYHTRLHLRLPCDANITLCTPYAPTVVGNMI